MNWRIRQFINIATVRKQWQLTPWPFIVMTATQAIFLKDRSFSESWRTWITTQLSFPKFQKRQKETKPTYQSPWNELRPSRPQQMQDHQDPNTELTCKWRWKIPTLQCGRYALPWHEHWESSTYNRRWPSKVCPNMAPLYNVSRETQEELQHSLRYASPPLTHTHLYVGHI